jgi:CHASE2 domain-containing sensor protein/predicted Ser/Thr protein kinase
MSYCINPQCGNRCNPANLEVCQDCGSNLVICNRYRIIKPLRQLDEQHHTEVFEIDDVGIPKILKVLTSNRRRLVELFEQESKILQQLEHLSISRWDSYFTFVPNHSNRKLRCLVMEKVEGENLKQWLKTNGKLTETKAVDWLKQLLAILVQVHKQRILHRDLKPSNIIIRPDGKLILIDFGTARKITTTYIEKLEDSDITRVYSPGYTAPEQLQGQAVFRSDFFALGRTFMHLMTGVYPDDLPKTQTNQLIWHNLAPQISRNLQDLIDRTIALSPLDRPHAAAILNQLNQVSDQPTAVWHNRPLKSWQRQAVLILNSSMAIAFFVIGIRYLGWLQPMELQAFDRLMQLRPLESPDSRIVLVTVDEADIQYQNQQNMSLRWSLADEALAQLLAKIKPYQPRTIGIDIYRDFAVESDYPDLAQELQTSDRLYAVCKVPAPQDGNLEGTPPPPEVPLSRLGFSDFVADSGDVIRRQLIHLNPPATSNCRTEYAFSLQLALDYLHRNGIEPQITPAGHLQIGTSTFKPISKHSGGYQGIDAAGYQILLNYRSLKSVQDLTPQISLRDILSDRYSDLLQNLIKDRLIIIGVIASSSSDDWQTPYTRHSLVQKQIPGVYIQAQMISQIISTALDRRPLIWWWSNFWSTIWIGGWGLLGGILGWYLRRPLLLGSAIALVQLILFLSCWLIFLQAGWIPLIPAALSLLLSAIATVFFRQRLSKH